MIGHQAMGEDAHAECVHSTPLSGRGTRRIRRAYGTPSRRPCVPPIDGRDGCILPSKIARFGAWDIHSGIKLPATSPFSHASWPAGEVRCFRWVHSSPSCSKSPAWSRPRRRTPGSPTWLVDSAVGSRLLWDVSVLPSVRRDSVQSFPGTVKLSSLWPIDRFAGPAGAGLSECTARRAGLRITDPSPERCIQGLARSVSVCWIGKTGRNSFPSRSPARKRGRNSFPSRSPARERPGMTIARWLGTETGANSRRLAWPSPGDRAGLCYRGASARRWISTSSVESRHQGWWSESAFLTGMARPIQVALIGSQPVVTAVPINCDPVSVPRFRPAFSVLSRIFLSGLRANPTPHRLDQEHSADQHQADVNVGEKSTPVHALIENPAQGGRRQHHWQRDKHEPAGANRMDRPPIP